MVVTYMVTNGGMMVDPKVISETLQSLAEVDCNRVSFSESRFSEARLHLIGHEEDLLKAVSISGCSKVARDLNEKGIKISRSTLSRVCKEIKEDGYIKVPGRKRINRKSRGGEAFENGGGERYEKNSSSGCEMDDAKKEDASPCEGHRGDLGGDVMYEKNRKVLKAREKLECVLGLSDIEGEK